jgi:hypothetical protein
MIPGPRPQWKEPDDMLAKVSFLMLYRLGGSMRFTADEIDALGAAMGGQGAMAVECDGDGQCTVTMTSVSQIAQPKSVQ